MEKGEFVCEYLLNCAVLITYGADKLLVDGLFSGKQFFDLMDEEMENDLMEGKGRFAGLNFLLFTHCHNDHYNGSKIRRFVENHPGVTVILPPNARVPHEFFAQHESPLYILDGEEEEIKRLPFPRFTVEYMKCSHLTYTYPQHYCLNITGELGSVTFTGDMDLERLSLLSGFARCKPSLLFSNHLVLSVSGRREMLHALGYDKICFYHVPSEERDVKGYRKVARRNWKRRREEFPEGQMLLTHQVRIPMGKEEE